MLFQSHNQAIDHRAANAKGLGDFSDSQSIRRICHDFENSQATAKRLRGLGCHGTNVMARGSAAGHS
jgi:hypothetical protein